MSDETQTYGVAVELPAEAIPQHSVTVVAYFTPDGEMRYVVRTQGDAYLSPVLGLLELAKYRLLTAADD